MGVDSLKLRLEMLLVLILTMLLPNSFCNNTERTLKKERDIGSWNLKARKFLYYIFILFIFRNVFSWTYGVINDSDHPIISKLDMSSSSNLTFSTKGSHAKRKLEPKDCSFMLHAQAGFGEFSKGYSHDVEHLPRKR